MNTVPCCEYLNGCGAELQRTVSGTLVDGLAAHLTTVHGMTGPAAVELASAYVTELQAAR